jgi:hypothetical protein
MIDMVLSVPRPMQSPGLTGRRNPKSLLHGRSAKVFAVLAWRSHRDGVDARHGRFEDGRWFHRVLPPGLVALRAVIDRLEREFATTFSGADQRGSLPSEAADPVVSTEPRSWSSCARTIEPLTSVALRAPLAHARHVCDEVVHDLGWRGDLDVRLPVLSCRHRPSLAQH